MTLVKLDTTRANEATICFRNRIFLNFICIVRVDTSVATANFYVVDTLTSFLFYLKDIDILGVYLNNIINELICQDGKSISIFCK